VERTSILLHVIDASGEDAKPLEDYRVLARELADYNDELLERTQLVVLNKIDLIDERRLAEVETMFAAEGLAVIAVSALKKTGIDALKDRLADLLEEHRESVAS